MYNIHADEANVHAHIDIAYKADQQPTINKMYSFENALKQMGYERSYDKAQEREITGFEKWIYAERAVLQELAKKRGIELAPTNPENRREHLNREEYIQYAREKSLERRKAKAFEQKAMLEKAAEAKTAALEASIQAAEEKAAKADQKAVEAERAAEEASEKLQEVSKKVQRGEELVNDLNEKIVRGNRQIDAIQEQLDVGYNELDRISELRDRYRRDPIGSEIRAADLEIENARLKRIVSQLPEATVERLSCTTRENPDYER